MRRSTVGGAFAALALAITATAAGTVWLSQDSPEEVAGAQWSWNFEDDTLVVVDPATGRVIEEYPGAADPNDSTRTVYIDPATNEEIATVEDDTDIMAPLRRD